MNEIKSHLDDELKGVADYFSLYYEYMDNEIACDFYHFAMDELRHAKFWLDMLEIKEEPEFEDYKAQYEELKSLLLEGDRDEY